MLKNLDGTIAIFLDSIVEVIGKGFIRIDSLSAMSE
jgi:hypothetical protein